MQAELASLNKPIIVLLCSETLLVPVHDGEMAEWPNAHHC